MATRTVKRPVASKATIDTLLIEDRTFKPAPAFTRNANASDPSIYRQAETHPVKFWERQAAELVWKKKWTKGLEWKAPDAKWFVGGKLNVTESCLDRWVEEGRHCYRNKAAIIWEGEPGDKRVLTYYELWRQVNKFSNVLKKLGVKKGDRIAIYLPMIPELVISVLACARVGAIHSVVFGGFSPEALRDRINDAQAKLLITADGSYRRGQIIPLKHDADVALADCPSIEHCIIIKRGDFLLRVKEGRDHWYHRHMQEANGYCQPVYTDSEDPLFILYTSGTTGKPKGIIHSCGGYLTGAYATTKYVFDLKADDVFWCTADIGWVTGHSYIIYGPLANGATIVMYEGAPDWPDQDRFWQIVEDYGVSVFYTAPTAIRAFMKWGREWPDKHDLSTLRLLGSVGEPINPEAWVKQGGGYLAITKPWPGMLRGIWGDRQRYIDTYWSKWPGTYFPGDGAKIDKDGYFWILGRVDDVINTAGHRISTMEVESALVEHNSVAEAAVVGVPHELKGEALVAFVTLSNSFKGDDRLISQLKDFVARKIGALAKPERVIFAADLPKTRSGKIMRRLLRDVATGKVLGDTTTLSDPDVVARIKRRYEED
jgi:acetyl-CoA synthetase